MKNILFHLLTTVKVASFYGVNKAFSCLKDLSDPARQGSPYDLDVTYEIPSSKRRLPLFKKRMNWRI